MLSKFSFWRLKYVDTYFHILNSVETFRRNTVNYKYYKVFGKNRYILLIYLTSPLSPPLLKVFAYSKLAMYS